MCGIFAILNSIKTTEQLRKSGLQASRLLRHRGPDWNGMVIGQGHVLVHERLAIMDPLSGTQPFISGEYVLTINGEIYNYWNLINDDFEYKTKSDCEVILSEFDRHGLDFIHKLDGVYAFVLKYAPNKYIIARDPIGVIPLYWGKGVDGSIMIASEMKALGEAYGVKQFPPGMMCHVSPETIDMIPIIALEPHGQNFYTAIDLIKPCLYDAIKKRLMTHVQWGVLLSGGLDSSCIAAIVAEMVVEPKKINTFSIGLEGSPDLKAAAVVAKHIGSKHHEFTYTVKEGLNALEDVIYHLESYDITTIRASIPMYLMARKIRSLGIKMVLSGEGADEIFGGYLYFHNAPDDKAFFEELKLKLHNLHYYDCLRANKSMAAWGVEVRVPYLDIEFVNLIMDWDTKAKMPKNNIKKIEKWLLRKAMVGTLPPEIIWRQKEQFSDGVGYDWIDSLKETADNSISDKAFAIREDLFPVNTPKTKEGFLYRSIFEKMFKMSGAVDSVKYEDTVACSSANALKWIPHSVNNTDASGRSVAVHNNNSI
jgi:asparagine synthase (glutamine-hydrolysing)